jgi:hypothetical protein
MIHQNVSARCFVRWSTATVAALSLVTTQAFSAALSSTAASRSDSVFLTFVAALVFAAIHLLGRSIAFLRTKPRNVWLSAAGGISIAYVFVHILPELSHHQDLLTTEVRPFGLPDIGERDVYFAALVGLATFYGLELWARTSARRRAGRDGVRRPSRRTFWLQLVFYATFNLIIGYLLLHRDEADRLSLLTYAIAMAMHFVVADQGLREQFYPAYDASGKWVLAAAPILGWAMGVFIDVPPAAISTLFAFLAGAIILNVLKHELPEERQSDFFAFAFGAIAYATILVATGA